MYWLWDKKKFDFYSNKIAKICDYLISNFEAEVVFIPNCTYEKGPHFQDDRMVSEYIH